MQESEEDLVTFQLLFSVVAPILQSLLLLIAANEGK